MTEVRLSGLSKTFDNTPVLRDIDLRIASGRFCCFVGPSGCGKSTLLRLIAGLEEPSSGEIHIGEQQVNDTPPARRGVAMVFQSYALYPHMTVEQNMAFGLQQSRVDRREIIRRVREVAQLLQIDALLDRLPRQLSGGQRQRVAIGRAIVRRPRVFLFDEPLSNLDAGLRQQTRVEIAQLHQQLGSTMIYVTHDQVEAMTLADQIVVLRAGRIEQIGTPLDLYHHPANRFVAGFIGSPTMNFIDGRLLKADEHGAQVSLAGRLPHEVSVEAWHLTPGSRISCGIRPEHLQLAPVEDALMHGIVRLCERLGDHSLVIVEVDGIGQPLTAKCLPGDEPQTGQAVGLVFSPEHGHLFAEDGVASRRV